MPDRGHSSAPTPALPPTPPPTPLRIGVDLAPPPPMCFGLPGEPAFVGFEVDLLHAIGARLGRPIVAEAALWADLLAQLDTQALDLICTAVTITPAREQRFAFSQPYLATGLTIVSRRDHPIALATATSADALGTLDAFGTLGALAPGARIAARINTPAERFAREAAAAASTRGGAPIEVATFHHNEEIYAALRDGSAAAVVDDWPIGAWFAAQSPALSASGIIPGTHAVYGLAMRKGDVALVTAVNRALDALMADGTYADLYRTWMSGLVGDSCDITRTRPRTDIAAAR